MAKITGIVGLDLSVTSTGLARMSIDGEDLFQHEAFGTKTSHGTNMMRYVFTARKIKEVTKPTDLFFIEGFAFGKPNRMAMLGELNGVVKLVLMKYTKREPFIVQPGTWKKFLSGNGQLNKDEFKLHVYKKVGLEVKTNDEAAAIALCLFGAHLVRGDDWQHRPITKVQLGLLKKYRKDTPELASACK